MYMASHKNMAYLHVIYKQIEHIDGHTIGQLILLLILYVWTKVQTNIETIHSFYQTEKNLPTSKFRGSLPVSY
jgi:hypothetical protein